MSASWMQLFFQIFLLLVSCRHINTKTPGPTPTPLAPVSPLTTEVRSAVFKGESQTEKIELTNPVSLTLECTWAGNLNKPPNITGYWNKDGDEIENSHVTVQVENGQYNLKREFRIVNKENLGNYSCMFGNEAQIDFILTAPQIGEVRDKPVVSYTGDFTVILCKMEETKPKPLNWNWYRGNNTEKISINAQPERYEIKNEGWTTKLKIYNLSDADSGLYYCEAAYAISTTMSPVKLKVITFWEPLKPFIAILIEVIVLVAAILLYERSQSKKNSVAETGTNADHTNTLTQGENSGSEGSSSMRQRKV
ncbi:embigin isoform X2 [Toxotes jaculatrix]|uniref:embigin isoform X2 n=1 Tax=Toxotes jaculatrix TaxID=941984 RepID=UPI001B3AE441|nr:embigin isoform X2 [Toxotes jaculatrix]